MVNRKPALTERIALFRPLTMEMLHPEIRPLTGSDARTLSAPGDISFTVAPEWADVVAEDGEKVFSRRGTLVVVERPNRTIRAVGLVDDLSLSADALTVSCGGLSMLAGQSGPWEGAQQAFMNEDPVDLFRMVWEQAQSYDNADLGIQVVGDTSSGSTVGYPGSSRWQKAYQDVQQYAPQLEYHQGRLAEHERILNGRLERMFRAAGLRRVGDVTVSDNEPDPPGYKADSTLWIWESEERAYRWSNGRWASQGQANDEVYSWLVYHTARDNAKAEVDRLTYLVEPARERLDEYADAGEGREEYSLHFWQNHDMNTVIEDLTALGPFEYREEAEWADDGGLELMLRVGAPTVGVRRGVHLELGHNVQEQPVISAPGETYTGVALFGAGEGSEILSAQRDWGADHVVRRILTETDSEAHNKQLTRAAADRLAHETRAEAQAGFTDLVIHYGDACPDGSFDVGDILPVTGVLPDGSKQTQLVRVLDMSSEWGSQKTSVEVEMVA